MASIVHIARVGDCFEALKLSNQVASSDLRHAVDELCIYGISCAIYLN